jgi:hypothetical protein
VGEWDVVLTNPDAQSAVMVETFVINDPPPPPPMVSAFAPGYAFEGNASSITITGKNFYGTPSVLLQNRSGYTVSASDVVLDGNTLTCSVDFSDQPLGDYTVFVANPDGQYYRMIHKAFSVKKQPLAANAFRVGAAENGFVIRWRVQNTEDFNTVTIFRGNSESEFVAVATKDIKDGNWNSYTDTGVMPGQQYDYRLLLGGVGVENVWSDTKGSVYSKPTPARTILLQNAPNPFNPATIIRYDLDKAQDVTLRVFDLTGRLVATLTNKNMPAGRHTVSWNGTDDHGRSVASGMYFYRLETNDSVQVRKMVLLK